EDNAKVHKLKVTGKFKKEHGIDILQWLLNSSDLSPIENIWRIIHCKRPLILVPENLQKFYYNFRFLIFSNNFYFFLL
ncbi:hypothetical protein PHYBLDRAFT_117632, partial [Phycomyces blakesleeanus NRRL 1555(-)]